MTRHAALANESVVVIGAGLAGCFLACDLRRRGYGQVILVERLDRICGVGPRVVTELHAGGEYPFDPRSAVDCLHGLAVLLRVLPTTALTKPRSHILIAEGTAATELPADRYADFLTRLRCAYEEMVRLDPKLEEDICPVSQFWRRLTPDEYADVRNVAGGFETPQRGVLPDVLAAAVEQSLRSWGVEVRLGHDVTSVVRRGRGLFRVGALTARGSATIDCSQVAFANHVLGFRLMMSLAGDHFTPPPSVFVALRVIAAAAYPEKRVFPAPTRLMLEGRFGAMDAPLDGRRALVYHPPLSHLAVMRLRPPYTIPENWLARRARPADEDIDAARRIIARAAEIAYPYLDGAILTEARVAIAANSVADSRVRRNMGLLRMGGDCVSLAFTTKATTTALNAERAGQLLVDDVCGRQGRDP